MSFERQISAEEIEHYLKKGSEKAAQVFERAANNPPILKSIYDAVLRATDHTLDNLSKNGYARKDDIYNGNGQSISEVSLRKLMLCAVESVQCLEELEPHLQNKETSSPDMDVAIGLDRHMRLLSAVTVFRTDGKDDMPAWDLQEMINKYRHNHVNLAA